jgi:predicted ribosomally synthesized peptide with SipW-like signal peptide
MRKQISILLMLAIGVVMAIGTTGTSATFTSAATASETITVGNMHLVLSDGNGTVNPDGSYTCPPVNVLSSTGVGDECQFKLSVEGGIVPSMVLIAPVETGAAEGAKFTIFDGIPTGANWPLDPPGHAFTIAGSLLPLVEKFHVEWADLTDASMGNVITLTLNITAIQS